MSPSHKNGKSLSALGCEGVILPRLFTTVQAAPRLQCEASLATTWRLPSSGAVYRSPGGPQVIAEMTQIGAADIRVGIFFCEL